MMSGKSLFPNGTVFFHNNVVFINGTVIQLHIKEPYRDSQLNELLYVVIVIVFYATALMTLIITQIRRQRREGSDIDYYDEYLQRNQEVKRTCQTAVKVFVKQDPPQPPTLNLPENVSGSTNTLTDSEGGGDTPKTRRFQRERSPIRKERSPMLESIPDEEAI